MIRLPEPEVFEEDLVQSIVIVLAGIYESMIELSVRCLYPLGKPYYPGSLTQYGHQFKLAHICYTSSLYVSGFSGSKGSLAHISVTMSSSPSFTMQCT